MQTKAAVFNPANAKLRRINFLWMDMKAGPIHSGLKYVVILEAPDLAKAATFDPANAPTYLSFLAASA